MIYAVKRLELNESPEATFIEFSDKDKIRGRNHLNKIMTHSHENVKKIYIFSFCLPLRGNF